MSTDTSRYWVEAGWISWAARQKTDTPHQPSISHNFLSSRVSRSEPTAPWEAAFLRGEKPEDRYMWHSLTNSHWTV